jgi:hypothetical protein
MERLESCVDELASRCPRRGRFLHQIPKLTAIAAFNRPSGQYAQKFRQAHCHHPLGFKKLKTSLASGDCNRGTFNSLPSFGYSSFELDSGILSIPKKALAGVGFKSRQAASGGGLEGLKGAGAFETQVTLEFGEGHFYWI